MNVQRRGCRVQQTMNCECADLVCLNLSIEEFTPLDCTHFVPFCAHSNAEYWDGIQSDARAVTAFLITIDVGHRYARNLTRKARPAVSRRRAGLRLRNQRRRS